MRLYLPMKSIYLILSFLFALNSMATESRITCLYKGEDGDDETITGTVLKGEVSSVNYQTFQDHLGPFVSVKKNIFRYSKTELIYELMIRFNEKLTTSQLEIYLKQNQQLITKQIFNCNQN